jgi:hypothetical protein
MTIEEMKGKAVTKVEEDNPGSTVFRSTKIFENILDGTVVTVSFTTAGGKMTRITSISGGAGCECFGGPVTYWQQ